MSAPVAWEPTAETIERAHVTRLMRRHGLASLAALRAWAVADIARFWAAVVDDLAFAFDRPWARVLDLDDGPAAARWFVGGEVNLAVAAVERPAARHPDRFAVVGEREDGAVTALTYAELARQVVGTGELLRAHGVGPGDRVAVLLPPGPDAVVALYAIARIGAVAVPIFSGFGSEAVAVRLRDSGARAVMTADGVRRRGRVRPLKASLDVALRSCPAVRHVLVVALAGAEAEATLTARRDVAWRPADPPAAPAAPAHRTGAEDPFLLIHTSGTTGRPKGALHVHGGFGVKVAAEVAYQLDVGPGDVAGWITDMGWIMGPWLMLGCHLRGATLVLYDGAPDVPDADRVWALAARHGLTVLGVSPTLVRALMAAGSRPARHAMDALRILASGGEPWNERPYEWLMAAGGGRRPIVNLSGGTEVGACLLSCHPVEPIRACSLGGPALGMDLDVLDADGCPVRGGVGELVCRQPWPSMTRGLWRDPDGYRATYWSTYPGLWRHGDWARVDENGAWYLLGRSDDVISVGGKRVGPAEVESLLVAHPSVAEAAAVGVPDPVKGEAIWCFCVLVDGAPVGPDAARDLRERVAAALGRPYAPARVVFVADLPRTRSAKIVRRVVRACATGADPGDLSTLENPGALDGLRAAALGPTPEDAQ